MIVRSPWNRKLLPGHEEDRLLCQSDQDACGGNYNHTSKKTNVGVIVSGRHDLPSYARTFSLTSFEMLNSFAAK